MIKSNMEKSYIGNGKTNADKQKRWKLIVVNLHDDGYSKRMNAIIASKSCPLSDKEISKTREGIKERPTWI